MLYRWLDGWMDWFDDCPDDCCQIAETTTALVAVAAASVSNIC